MTDVKQTRTAEIKKMYAEDLPNQKAGEEQAAPGGGGETFVPVGVPGSLAPKKKSKAPKVILTLILIIVVVFVVLLIISKTTNWDVLNLAKWTGQSRVAGVQDVVKASDWQAVFLSNGQVYFGKLKNVNDAYPVLEDIYYLQLQNVPIQPAEPASEEEGVQPAQQTEQQMILVKFGTELHRPMDKMYINKDHILLFEDLASDSNVVIAIENYKAGLTVPVK